MKGSNANGIQEARKLERDFQCEFNKACRKQRGRFLDYLTDNIPSAVVGVKPYGIFFARLLHRYLWLECGRRDLSFMLLDAEGSDIQPQMVVGRKILLVDDDVISGTTCQTVREVIWSVEPAEVLFVTWDDHSEDRLSDVVLNPEHSINKRQHGDHHYAGYPPIDRNGDSVTFLSLREISERHSIPMGTLYAWIHGGLLTVQDRRHPGGPQGGKILIDESELVSHLKNRRPRGRPPKI